MGLPNLRRAMALASFGDRPRATFSAVSISRYDSISRVRSWSHQLRFQNRRQLNLVLRRPQDAVDGANDTVPTAGLDDQLFPAGRSKAVVAGLPVVVRGPPEGRDPATIFKAM